MKKLNISLVIPVRNEGDRVDFTMQSLIAGTRLPDEIIVADGESTDDTKQRFLAYKSQGINIKVVPNTGIYSGAGRNVGASASCGDIILFADCGNALAENWVEEMALPFEKNDEIEIVCGVVVPHVENEFEHHLAAIQYTNNYNVLDSPDEIKALYAPSVVLPGGGCIGMKKATFDKLGGYPSWLHRAQDKLMSRKAFALGLQVFPNWNVRIHHHMRSNIGEVFKLTYEYGRGNGRSRFVSRHFLKLILVYGFITSLLLAGVWHTSLLIAGILLLLAYSIRAGSLKVIRKDKGIKTWKVFFTPIVILWARDFGTISGHTIGWLEWVFVPKYRKKFWAYLQECDEQRLFILEPK